MKDLEKMNKELLEANQSIYRHFESKLPNHVTEEWNNHLATIKDYSFSRKATELVCFLEFTEARDRLIGLLASDGYKVNYDEFGTFVTNWENQISFTEKTILIDKEVKKVLSII